MKKVSYALISVFDKTGIQKLALQLHNYGITILATKNTASYLKKASIPAIEISDYTQFPEILSGRVKTLHPKIFAGILANRNKDKDLATLDGLGVMAIDYVIVNLYPFSDTIKKANCTKAQAIEQIDIGGISLIRAAAKNHNSVTVITDINDYDIFLQSFNKITTKKTAKVIVSQTLKTRFAKKAFLHCINYDTHIYNYLDKTSSKDSNPQHILLNYIKQQDLPYGENPHQEASFYKLGNTSLWFEKLSGNNLSYNNIVDGYSAVSCLVGISLPSCVIIKHTNPCGMASAKSLSDAYLRAYQSDKSSSYGGILAFNKKVDIKTANLVVQHSFIELLLCPDISKQALNIISIVKKNLPILKVDFSYFTNDIPQFKQLANTLLCQKLSFKNLTYDYQVVSKKKPTKDVLQQLLFAWYVVRYVKSNAIVLVKNMQTIGIGVGQVSRIFAIKAAALKAQENNFSTIGSVMASDGFLPFADNITQAHSYNITAIIQPGGSKKDSEVIALANKLGIIMIFTGIRHFSH